MSELPPCPFCGSFFVTPLTNPPTDNLFVGCDFCEARGPSAWTEADAIEFWSKRAPHSAEAEAKRLGAIEALREIVHELGVRAKSPTSLNDDIKAIVGKIEELLKRYEATGKP